MRDFEIDWNSIQHIIYLIDLYQIFFKSYQML